MNRRQKKYRDDKRALATDLLSGKADKNDLADYKKQLEPFSMTVYCYAEPGPTDLVDTQLADEQGRSRIPYADFLKDPVKYGSHCIAVEEDYE